MDSNVHSKYFYLAQNSSWAIVRNHDGRILLVDDNYELISFVSFIIARTLEYRLVKLDNPVDNLKCPLLSLQNNKIKVTHKQALLEDLQVQEKLMFIRHMINHSVMLVENAKTIRTEKMSEEFARLDSASKFFAMVSPELATVTWADIMDLNSYATRLNAYQSRIMCAINELDINCTIHELNDEIKQFLTNEPMRWDIERWINSALVEVL